VHIVMLAAVYLVQEVTPAHKGQLGGTRNCWDYTARRMITQVQGLSQTYSIYTGAFTNIQYLHRGFHKHTVSTQGLSRGFPLCEHRMSIACKDVMISTLFQNLNCFFNTTMIIYLKKREGRKHATGSR
jgi:hypothetical protein